MLLTQNVDRLHQAAGSRVVAALEQAQAMLIAGSSLMVYSGFRFAQAAARLGIPIAAVNLGRTCADAPCCP